MTRKRNRKPTHPGYLFRHDVLDPLDLNLTETADKLGISRKHLSGFVNGRTRCNLDMAQRLAIATDTSIASWLNMQTELDIWEVENNPEPQYSNVEYLEGSAA
ncbi:MAG: addiction module HigA family antidote [Oceanicoccus sp.]|jgi:addiction module HigA family antidote